MAHEYIEKPGLDHGTIIMGAMPDVFTLLSEAPGISAALTRRPRSRRRAPHLQIWRGVCHGATSDRCYFR